MNIRETPAYRQRIGVSVLCNLIGFSERALIKKCLSQPEYREVKISKKREGEFRTLHIPGKDLMYLQKLILKRVLEGLDVSRAAHCGVIGCSIRTNVTKHLRGNSFLKIDFKDTYPSVNRDRIKTCLGYLLKNTGRLRNYNLEELGSLAEIISRLTTYKDALPQGAPTSPCILNLVCLDLDRELTEISEAFELSYTRYADDLCFSSELSEILLEARKAIVRIIKKHGVFSINRKKFVYKTGKATVPKITGLTIVGRTSRRTSLSKKVLKRYQGIINKAIQDETIGKERVFGIIGRVIVATNREIPRRLRGPFKEFLVRRCPEKLGRYKDLL
jgi:hypothetical protein